MKKKKTLVAIIALLLVVVVGATFAYYTSSTSFENVFNAGKYKVTLTEVFESPDNWVPGETVPKTVTAKNDGTVPAAVRISYTEQWLDEEENDITSQVTPNPAIINFANTGEWTLNNGYYYYKYILNPNDETSSFISGVTLDPNLNGVTCTGSGNTKTCEGTNNATGATYKLTLTIETVQADKYQSVWNTEQAIGEKPLVQIMNSERNKNNLQVGDEICINGDTTECFNFIDYDGDNIVMLSKYNLKVGNIYDSSGTKSGEYTSADDGYGLQSSEAKGYVSGATIYGTVAFSGTNYWYDGSSLKPEYNSESNPNNIYDTDYNEASGNNYSVAYYVDGYKTKLTEYGLTVNDARLLTYSEASYYLSIGTGFIGNTSFWLSSAAGGDIVCFVYSGGVFSYGTFSIDNTNGVRPVIVISKSDI